MKLGGLGVPELLIILVVVLLIFGPKNLPKLGSALGKTVKGLRDGMGAGKKKEVKESSDKVAEDNAENVEDAEILEEVVEEQPSKPAAAASKPKQVKKVVVKKTQ